MSDKFYKLPQDLTARKDLKASDKIVYAVILDHIGQNRTGWPGIRRLMKKTGLCNRTVIKSIDRLSQAGLLEVIRRGNGKTNHYRSGEENSPVKKTHRCKKLTTGGEENSPEAVKKTHHNQTDPLNQTKYIYGEFVKLTNGQHEKLIEKFGKDGTADRIEALNEYIGSTGKKYNSHYHTILTWERRERKKDAASKRTAGKESKFNPGGNQKPAGTAGQNQSSNQWGIR